MVNTLRMCFIAHPGYIFVSIDASQIELRVLAILSQDPRMLEDLKTGDLHAATAIRMFGMPTQEEALEHLEDEEITTQMIEDWIKAEFKKRRYKAKQGNFALVYGADENKLSQMLECSIEEAAEFMADHRTTYPVLYAWMDAEKKRVKEAGFTTNMFGRIRPLPALQDASWKVREKAEREIINTIVQGTAVDVVKMMGLYLRKELDRSILFIMQVHDEWVLEVPEVQLSLVLEKAKELALAFPDYPVGISTGYNYGNMAKLEEVI